MKKIFTCVWSIQVAMFTVLMIASCSSSRRSIGIEEGWEIISESKVNFVRDKDEVMITSPNQYTALRFRVEDRDVRINDLKIYFQNGDKLEPNLDDVIAADETSRTIELAQDGRYLNKIEFRYRTTGNVLKGRANVIVIGKRYYPGY